MERFDRIFRLHQILESRRLPVSRRDLEEQLECSRATVKRIIEDMRDNLNAPIVYDRVRNGYCYDAEQGEIFDLPDLTTGPTRALTFGCTCSQDVAEASFATRSKLELDGLVRMARPQTFRCHLCGRVYTLPPEKLFQLALAAK